MNVCMHILKNQLYSLPKRWFLFTNLGHIHDNESRNRVTSSLCIQHDNYNRNNDEKSEHIERSPSPWHLVRVNEQNDALYYPIHYIICNYRLNG